MVRCWYIVLYYFDVRRCWSNGCGWSKQFIQLFIFHQCSHIPSGKWFNISPVVYLLHPPWCMVDGTIQYEVSRFNFHHAVYLGLMKSDSAYLSPGQVTADFQLPPIFRRSPWPDKWPRSFFWELRTHVGAFVARSFLGLEKYID